MNLTNLSKDKLISELNKIDRKISDFTFDLREQEKFMVKIVELAFKPIVLLVTLGMSIPLFVAINTITVLLVIFKHQILSTEGLEEERREIEYILRDKFNYYSH